MSVAAHAPASFGRYSPTLKTPRDLEYETLARITGRLQAALPHRAGQADADLVSALDRNRELWTVFATDLAHPHNGLPPDLRARLFYLAQFTLQHTARILAGEARIDPLIDINMAVLRGLRSRDKAQ